MGKFSWCRYRMATQGRRDSEEVLRVEGVSKYFGNLKALNDVDLSVRENEIVGLIGPNGAGKTTLLNCITGKYRVSDGSVYLNGDDVTDLNISRRVNRGMARTYQIVRTFGELTVRENMIAHVDHRNESLLKTVYRGVDDEDRETIDELLEFFELSAHAEEPAGNLSTGQKKLLNIAASLISDPEVVLLDEPAAGVNPALVEDIEASILEQRTAGRTFFVVEHEMDVITTLCDHLYVLVDGENFLEGPPAQVLDDDRVLKAYFGE